MALLHLILLHGRVIVSDRGSEQAWRHAEYGSEPEAYHRHQATSTLLSSGFGSQSAAWAYDHT